MVALQFVASNLQVTNHRLNLMTSLKVCQIYKGRTSRILCWSSDRCCVICSIDLIFSIACIHENRLIGHTIHIIDDCIGAGNINRILSHHRCLHSHVVEASISGQCLEHEDVGQTTIDILCAVDYAFELHHALLVAFVNDFAVLVVKQFVCVITVHASLGEEGEIHFHISIFTCDAETVLFWLNSTVVESDVHF